MAEFKDRRMTAKINSSSFNKLQNLVQFDEKVMKKIMRWGPNVKNINVKNNRNINVEF